MNITEYIRFTVKDFMKYLDTTIPNGVKPREYTHLKYGTMNMIHRYTEEHPEVPIKLVEKVALFYFLRLPDEQIIKTLKPYIQEEVNTEWKHSTRTSQKNKCN